MADQPTNKRTGAVTSLEDPPSLAPQELVFADRADAGLALARILERLRAERPLVVGMARGGVPVAAEVARALGAPLDVIVVRKIGAPENPEFALGAVAEGGIQILSKEAVAALGLSDADLQPLLTRAQNELLERSRRYRGATPSADVAGRTVILVDDGLATGRSARAAIRSLRQRGAARIVLAVPVAAPASLLALRAEADEVVCVEAPRELWAVGFWYEDFRPVTDDEVMALIAGAAARTSDPPVGAGVVSQQLIDIGLDAPLSGDLGLPADARGIVVFAHGSGSSRLSPRNRRVAGALREAGYATLLFDLLTASEESDRANVFDIPLLASRLVAVSEWLTRQPACARLPLAYFGASTGAAAALDAAAELGGRVRSVISRGGRPDLAARLADVRAPTLLIVGGADLQVLELNRDALRQLRCESELAIVPGATHLFEEPGALERVTQLAVAWLARHGGGSTPPSTP